MYELRALGTYSDIQIVGMVNRLGYKSRLYKRRDKRSKKVIGQRGQKLLTVKQMQKFIANPIYAGVISEKWTQYKPVKAQFQGIVDVDTFNAVNRGKVAIVWSDQSVILEYGDNLSLHKSVKRRVRDNPNYPYRGVVMCPLCSKPLTASASRGRSGKKYPAYHCSRDHKSWRVSTDTLDESVQSFAHKLEFREELLKLFELSFMDVWRSKRQDVVKDSQLAEQHVAELLIKQNSVFEAISGVSSATVMRRLEIEYDALERQIEEARSERIDKEKKELDVKKAVKYALYLMEHPQDLLINTDNPLQKKQVFSLFFEALPTYSQLNNGTANLSPVFSLNSNQNLNKSSMVTPSGFEPELTG